ARRRQFGRQPHASGAISDARREHRLLIAEQRIQLALRYLSTCRDFQGARFGVAELHEGLHRGVQDSLTRRLRTELDTRLLSLFLHENPLAVVPAGTVA